MRIYLDNCSYNRPYDNQSQMRIYLETQAKLYIQELIKQKKLKLVTSYVLDYENSRNRSSQKRMAIEKFMEDYATFYVSNRNENRIKEYVTTIMETGVKEKDAYHVACAILAECEYFITTDDRLLKYQSENIKLVTPGEFIREVEVDYE
ncbi:MAG: type II toxin-antitoxin system VapC family toxin [Lachnospiraceae bacterium]|jgi:predicted nucleic acid-binding protein|nr:type II toxin-antitoxin system VapC family toxin [Lachnospiraceae bacterium]